MRANSWYDLCCSSFLLFPFLSPVDKVIYFLPNMTKWCSVKQAGHASAETAMLTFQPRLEGTHSCWVQFYSNSSFPNQDKTLHISKTTQVVLMPRTLQCLYSARHTREQECHFKNVFFCCQAAGASKQFLAACTFMQLDACVFRVYTLMFVSAVCNSSFHTGQNSLKNIRPLVALA